MICELSVASLSQDCIHWCLSHNGNKLISACYSTLDKRHACRLLSKRKGEQSCYKTDYMYMYSRMSVTWTPVIKTNLANGTNHSDLRIIRKAQQLKKSWLPLCPKSQHYTQIQLSMQSFQSNQLQSMVPTSSDNWHPTTVQMCRPSVCSQWV